MRILKKDIENKLVNLRILTGLNLKVDSEYKGHCLYLSEPNGVRENAFGYSMVNGQRMNNREFYFYLSGLIGAIMYQKNIKS